jgi:ADP-ribose pyrophosphatase
MAGEKPRTLGQEVIYDGRKVRLEVHRIEEPGGRQAIREVVRHNGSVAILAFRTGAGGGREVLLEHNYRYGVGRYVTEIPAGTLDRPDEPPADCARRELIEETGCRTDRLEKLTTILPSPGILTEQLTIYLAEDVRAGEAQREPGELIEVVWTPWAEALDMVGRGEIEDAKTIVAVLYYEMYCRKKLRG